ncbi:MAG: CaiB/BaiF CoA-transferase family protein [Pseudomonadota bacterium]
MQPFEGIRVLDFTHVLAGPFATYQLAVLGAEVIKIEPRDLPDMMRAEGVSPKLNAEGRGTRYQCQAGNKRSVVIDLTSERGRDLVHRLAETADVAVSNFRIGTMARLGLGADALQARNPELIWCTLSGYGATGAKAADPAYDNVIQASSGLLASTGHPDGAPVKVGPAVLDYGTGAQAAFAIAAALFQRTRTGVGQRIDVSMLDAALMLMTSSVSDSAVRGGPPAPSGNSDPVRPGYGLFDTADGQLMIGAFTERQTVRLWTALGDGDMAQAVVGRSALSVADQTAEDKALLQTYLLGRSADAWEEKLNAAGVPAARVRSMHEAMLSAQVGGRPVLQDGVIAPETGLPIATPVAAFRFEDGSGPRLERVAQRHGADTDDVLCELGIAGDDISALRADGVI